MQLDRQSKRLCRAEHPRRLLSRKAMPSMKASTASARPACATAGSISPANKIDVSILVAISFRRQRVRAKKRRRMLTGRLRPSARAADSWRISVSVLSP
jgi:hypothetical protein